VPVAGAHYTQPKPRCKRLVTQNKPQKECRSKGFRCCGRYGQAAGESRLISPQRGKPLAPGGGLLYLVRPRAGRFPRIWVPIV